MSVETYSPEANYLTRSNIVHPLSNLPGTQGDARITALETRARNEYADRTGLTLTGGTIKKGK
jgi:hypothetical protein